MVNSSDTGPGGQCGPGEQSGRRRVTGPIGLAIGVLAGLALVTAACAGTSDNADDRASGEADGGTVLVFAAASLTEVMAEAEAVFEAANPTIDVTLNIGGSASLRTQILEGAPADVVATANPAIMADLVAAGRIVDRPTTLATNQLVIAVAPGNPAGVEGLDDLADPDRFIGLCAPEVPCGDLADRAAAEADVIIEADTREPDVRSLLAKIEAGELDAGLVYRTDVVASAEEVTAIELPDRLPTTTDYPVAALTESDNPAAADAFVAFLAGPEGRRILTGHGFKVP